MDIPAHLIDGLPLVIGYVLFALVTLVAVWTAPWFKIRDSSSLNVFLGAVVILMLLWTMRAGIQPGLNFHLLGATALTLMFGWQFAWFAITLIVVGITTNGNAGWDALPLNVLLMGGIPIAVTQTALFLAQRFLPHNYFIYIFLNSFLAAGLSSIAVALTAYTVYRYSGIYPVETLNTQYLPFMLLVALPESTLNGITMTGTVVYKPEWVASFHDRWYLYKK